MTTVYFLGCIKCRVFLALGDFDPDKYKGDLNYRSPYKDYSGHSIPLNNVMDAISDRQSKNADNAFQNLLPYITGFCRIHGRHELYVFSDVGVMPWDYYGSQEWDVWKEVYGPLSFWGDDRSLVLLPKNLVEDLEIMDWSRALRHYKKAQFLEISDDPKRELETIKKKYESCLSRYLTKLEVG